MTAVTWYFDVVSPFAYLQWQRLKPMHGIAWTFRPVLFAALLQHYGHCGPAEFAEKRRFTYRHLQWRAARAGIPLRFPPAHPFNPLPALRLCCVAGNTAQAIDHAFDFVWREGRGLVDPGDVSCLAHRLGIDDPAAALADPAAKATLLANATGAIADGVFGVPSLVAGGHVFWGEDATDMFLDYLADPGLFDTQAIRRLDALPVGAIRKQWQRPTDRVGTNTPPA